MNLPFDNDTSTVVKKLVQAESEVNKRRNLLAGIIIFFASLLLTFVSILLVNATLATQIISHVDNAKETITVIFAIAIVLLVTSGLAIKNIMYISVLQRTQEFAQLRTLGATYRQIIAVVNGERKQLAWKFIVNGVLSGVLCNIILPLRFYLLPGIMCAVFSGAFVWFIVFCSFHAPAKQAASVSPIAALKKEQTYRYSGRRSTDGHITPQSMGRNYFRSDYKKAGYTLLSLILSGILMFTVFSVFSSIDIEMFVRQSYYADSALYLKLASTASEDSTYNLMRDSPFTESLRAEIEKTPGVTGIYSSKRLDCEVFNPDTPERAGVEKVLNGIVEEAGFEKLLVEGGLPYRQGDSGIIQVVVNRTSIYYESAGFDLELGDMLAATVDTGYSDRQVQFAVCGFIEDKDDGSVFYTSSDCLDSLAEMNCDLAWYVCIDENQTETAVEKIISLVSSDHRLNTAVLQDDLTELRAYFHNAEVAVAMLILLVSLFSFINLLNTCITNTIIRRYDYALLEAAGMTKSEIRQMQDAENAIYFFGSLIGSCVIGTLLGRYICNTIAQMPGLSYISYQFPWAFLVLYIIFVLVIYAVVTLYQKRLFLKQSVVERLRNW